jgi:hypothetical protein
MITVEYCDLRRKYESLITSAKSLEKSIRYQICNKILVLDGYEYLVLDFDDSGIEQLRFNLLKKQKGSFRISEAAFWIQMNNCPELANLVEPCASAYYQLLSLAYDARDDLEDKYRGRECMCTYDLDIYIITRLVTIGENRFYLKAEHRESGREVAINRFNYTEWNYV